MKKRLRDSLLAFALLPASGVLTMGYTLRTDPNPVPGIAKYLALPPKNCPPTNAVHWVFGGGWPGDRKLVGYSDWTLMGHRATLTFGRHRTPYGYAQKIFWQFGRGFAGPVSLHGWNLQTKRSIWFGRSVYDPHPKALVPPRVIAWPAATKTRHKSPSLTFVPAAGCYEIVASWRDGGWKAIFAAGADFGSQN